MQLTTLVNSSLDPSEVRRRAIEAATTLLEAEAGSLLLLDRDRTELYFEVACGERGEQLKEVRLPHGEGIAGWVAKHGIPQIVHDVRQDPRFYREVDELTSFVTRDIVCVPVRIKEKTIGALEAVNKRGGRFEDDDMEILLSLANQVAIALENATLCEENYRNLKAMLAEEKRHLHEKEMLLKDLHDGIGGITTNINLLAELALKSSTIEDIRMYVSTISELSREGSFEIRSFMNTIENREATWNDLAAEFRRHGSHMIESHQIEFSIATSIEDGMFQTGTFLFLTLFRIYKEALANVIKHSQATMVKVEMKVTSRLLELLIQDNGVGLPNGVALGRGIANMRTRAREIGGDISITATKGTSIHLSLPLPVNYQPIVSQRRNENEEEASCA
jgi:signal transduction histidine kinase